MSATVEDQQFGFVEASTRPEHGPAVSPAKRKRFGRVVKISAAATLLAGSAGAVLLGHGRVTADNAVVSAYILPVRSPIQGQVSGLRLQVGDAVSGSTVLARVTDARASDERVVELRSELARNQAEKAALQAQRRALTEMRVALAARSEEHRTAQVAYTGASSTEATAQLMRSRIRLELAQRDMGRKVSLGRTGDTSVASVDRATLDAGAAEADLASQAAHLAYLRAREAAAVRGVFVDSGANDVSYSTQRMDEIDLRLADIDRATAVLAAGRTMTEARLAAEERRLAALSVAELRTPDRGMIWKLGSSNGERVSPGDTLAQVIDCGTSFIVASIPQRDFSSVELGSVARFRLSGETADREGRVLSVTGDATVSGDRNLAAAPVPDRAATAVVRVQVPASGNSGAECLVGRTARVLLPAPRRGLFSRLLQRLS